MTKSTTNQYQLTAAEVQLAASLKVDKEEPFGIVTAWGMYDAGTTDVCSKPIPTLHDVNQ
jgi:hypothetical protein